VSVSKGRRNAAFVFSEHGCCALAAMQTHRQGHAQALRATASASKGNTSTTTEKHPAARQCLRWWRRWAVQGAAIATACASPEGAARPAVLSAWNTPPASLDGLP